MENAPQNKKIFPKGFYWGASTAAHQVEGGNHNQWTVWELENAAHQAKTAQERYGWLPNWEEIKPQTEDPNNYISGKGVDHYSRYKEDFDLVQKLNCNSFRFSIEWSRLEPEEGVWDEEAVEHYRQYIRNLNERKIEPFLNLWHWTVPVWFDKKGGFVKRENLKYFDRFVSKVAKEYGHEVKHIITLNEPNVYTTYSYFDRRWPPQENSFIKAIKVYSNLIEAHKRAYKILKTSQPALFIGSAPQLGNIQAKRPHNLIDELITKMMRAAWNWWFLERTHKQHDFIGFNYYFTDYFKGIKRVNPQTPINDMGWYAEPEGLYPIMLRIWARYKKPIIVTENGIADQHDQYRRWWIEETIVALERAISEGVDVRGYFHWSLLDNFEWADGWWPKFGLAAVDREHNMARNVRPSAEWYAEKIKKLS